ncbi:hypothetical protein KGM_202899 [Danaus plexippus plexippus]|uniref:Uncharacterized protein n=1 Tax=Danaus plexippus plexippus TaxID=278856 RepID=A0A212F082_DANPL|nr:hypothetical protein KGM_202899 [Danaus plexippus plexippus]
MSVIVLPDKSSSVATDFLVCVSCPASSIMAFDGNIPMSCMDLLLWCYEPNYKVHCDSQFDTFADLSNENRGVTTYLAYLYGFECILSGNCESVLNNATCSFEVTCFGDFSEIVTEIFDNAGRCPATAFNVNNGHYYVPITLIYKSSIFFQSLINDGSFFIYVVRTLDLSGNNFDFQPTISTMYGLNSLNLSHNDISNAQLFNHEYELPNLRDIDLSHNAISNLDVTDSSSDYWFDNLIKINLSYNNIIKIPYQFFKYFKVLTTLDLSYNNISIVTSDTFEGISGLKYLNISSNKIIDINTSLFRFVQLIELNLSYNQISNVNKNNFDQLYELRELDISNNFIENIDDIVFVDVMPNLAIINVKYNRIRTLRKNLFLDLNNLKEIDFSYNNITYLPKNMFLRRNITFFSIKGNNLSGPLEKGLFEGMDSIPILDISHQSIRSVEDYTFFGLTKLTQLLLNDNRISNLTKNCFLSLQTLQRIDLSNNFIIRIDFVKSDLLSLQYFAVSNNLVEKIDVTDFFYLHKLQYLDLSRNNISKVYPKTFQMLSSLENLYLSKNPLVGSLDENTFDGLYSVPLLDLSDVSFNSIGDLEMARFDELPNLSELIVDHNRISEIDVNDLQRTGLRKLSIGDNPLPCNKLKELKDIGGPMLEITGLRYVYSKDESFKGVGSTPIIQTNLNNDTNDLSKLREELANSIVIEKEKMLAEIERKERMMNNLND